MADPTEQRRSARLMVPAQLVRTLLMSVVLYPLLGPLAELSFGVRFAFWKVQSEAIVYSLLFGGLASWLLF